MIIINHSNSSSFCIHSPFSNYSTYKKNGDKGNYSNYVNFKKYRTCSNYISYSNYNDYINNRYNGIYRVISSNRLMLGRFVVSDYSFKK